MTGLIERWNNMILINEVVHNGEVHLQVNSCFLEIAADLFPEDKVVFNAERLHVEAVKKLCSKNKGLEYLSFQQYYDTRQYSWINRITGEAKQIYASLKLGRRSGVKTYIWTCLFPTGHLFLNLITRFFNSKARHIIILHGELELLKNGNRRKSERFLGWILRIALDISRHNTKYIVLGDRIKTHLRKYVTKAVDSRVVAILHPYKYDERSFLLKERKKSWVFGAIGTQMLMKNSHFIFQLAEKLKQEVLNREFQLITIGKILPEIIPFKNNLVDNRQTDTFVPQVIFEQEIANLDFVLFFYDNDAYQLCASGAIFEVIRMGLPVVSLYNDYFDWLFEKYGAFGFLCQNLEEMKSVLLKIQNGEFTNEIQRIEDNINHFKNIHTLESIAKELNLKLCGKR